MVYLYKNIKIAFFLFSDFYSFEKRIGYTMQWFAMQSSALNKGHAIDAI